jgi:hypothetical protein
MTANEYMAKMRQACGVKLVHGGLYGGRDGHLRLAREIGYALNDFNDNQQRHILTSSYSVIYVRACFLNPTLDAKDWINEMIKGKRKAQANKEDKIMKTEIRHNLDMDMCECRECKKLFDRNEMDFTRDCQGIVFRLVCMRCWKKVMAKGYDGQYYDECDECLTDDY